MKQQEISQVHPGLNCFKDGVREIPIESIPGLKLTGWKPGNNRLPGLNPPKKMIEETMEPEVLYQALRTVLNQVNLIHFKIKKINSNRFKIQLKAHGSAWPFVKPVDRAEVPDYYDHIKYPMGKTS